MEIKGINKAIFRHIRSDQKILSVGCGEAILEYEAKKKGNYVAGIDISQENLKIAKEKIDKVYLADMNTAKNFPFKKESFDVIIFADVLEHLYDPKKVLEKIRPYLTKGGYILVSLPNVANWSVRIPLFFGSFNYSEGGIKNEDHKWFYTKKTGKQMIQKAGYIVKKIDYNTSLINIIREFLSFSKKGLKNDSQNRLKEEKEKQDAEKKSFLRKIAKYIVEGFDNTLTKLWPGMFAYQYIFVAKKK